MREVISIQIGQCGNSIGQKYWEVVCQEHGFDPTGTYIGIDEFQYMRCGTYYMESAVRKFTPRAILIDLDSGSLDSLRCSPYGQIFNPNNFLSGKGGSGNNYGKGRYTEGLDMLDLSLDITRMEVEKCDYLQGFQIVHGIGGGTGSGFGSLLIEKLREEYKNSVIMNYTVIPSPKVSNTVVEPYNAILSLPQLVNSSDMIVCFDNEALYDICYRTLRISNPSFQDLNHLISMVMVGTSACQRFPGSRNAGLRKLYMSLTPYHSMKFFIPSFVPLSSRAVQQYRTLTIQDLIFQAYDGKSMFCAGDMTNGKYITSAVIFRGQVSPYQVEQCMQQVRTRLSPNFVEWLPSSMKYAICDVPPIGHKYSATILASHTAVIDSWKRIYDSYKLLYKKRAFLHWFYGEGVSDEDFKRSDRYYYELVEEHKAYLRALPEVEEDDSQDCLETISKSGVEGTKTKPHSSKNPTSKPPVGKVTK